MAHAAVGGEAGVQRGGVNGGNELPLLAQNARPSSRRGAEIEGHPAGGQFDAKGLQGLQHFELGAADLLLFAAEAAHASGPVGYVVGGE